MNKMEVLREKWEALRVNAWLLGAGSAAVIVLALGLLFAYALPSSWRVTEQVRSVLPLPLATVGMSTAASYDDVADNLASVRRFYETQDFASLGMRVDFTTEDGKKRLKIREREIVNKMIEDKAMRILAAREGIVISEQEAAEAVARELEKIGGSEENVKEKLSRLYGWDLVEFQEKVVLPSLYEEALLKKFEEKYSRSEDARGKAEQAAKQLADGRDFKDVAMEFSDGRSAEDGGSMGWFAYADLIDPLQEPAKTQKVGIPGSIIESPLGFHILQIDERKLEGGKEMVRVSQVFSRKPTFVEWLAGQMSGMNVRVLAPEYEWNKEAARVEFGDPALRQFEEEILKKAEGDASLVF